MEQEDLEKKYQWVSFQRDLKYYPFWPESCYIGIEDIAGALSKICRYGGRIDQFYSVSQHSCLAYDIAKSPWKLHALTHDFSEAITGDCVSPIKKYSPEFKQMEDRIERALEKQFGLSYTQEGRDHVKWVDLSLLATEVHALVDNLDFKNKLTHKPLPIKIKPWSHKRAKYELLKRYYKERPEEKPKTFEKLKSNFYKI